MGVEYATKKEDLEAYRASIQPPFPSIYGPPLRRGSRACHSCCRAFCQASCRRINHCSLWVWGAEGGYCGLVLHRDVMQTDRRMRERDAFLDVYGF